MLNQYRKERILKRFVNAESINSIAYSEDVTISEVEGVVRRSLIRLRHREKALKLDEFESVPVVRSSCLR
jgi:hypothetical protein